MVIKSKKLNRRKFLKSEKERIEREDLMKKFKVSISNMTSAIVLCTHNTEFNFSDHVAQP